MYDDRVCNGGCVARSGANLPERRPDHRMRRERSHQTPQAFTGHQTPTTCLLQRQEQGGLSIRRDRLNRLLARCVARTPPQIYPSAEGRLAVGIYGDSLYRRVCLFPKGLWHRQQWRDRGIGKTAVSQPFSNNLLLVQGRRQ